MQKKTSLKESSQGLMIQRLTEPKELSREFLEGISSQYNSFPKETKRFESIMRIKSTCTMIIPIPLAKYENEGECVHVTVK